MDWQTALTRDGRGRRPRRAARALAAIALAASTVIGGPVARLLPAQPASAAATFADPFFREVTVFSGLTKPTSVRFATDGRAFVAEKAGIIKAFDSISDSTPTVVADLSADVMNYWDRGLLAIELDPAFLTGRPYLYAFYVWGAEPGDTTQDWIDACPAPPSGPGPTTDGCVASTKIDRLTIDLATNTMTARTNLIWDACQQFPSHSGGGMGVGPDGQLYVTFGDGASFNGVDFGQRGGTVPDYSNPFTPVNPCADPVTVTSAAGTQPTVDTKTAQGGQLRAQDVRTTADPTGLGGTLIRIDPDTGAASAGNPLASSGDANARRIVAHGFRNPFRLAFRPGTADLYVAHVGNKTWEAIDRIAIPTTAKTPTTLPNAGWPCYEGPAVATTFKNLGTDMCAALYAQGSAAWLQPFYTYSHVSTLLPTGPCFNPVDGTDGGAPTGLAFYEGSTGGTADYPARYVGGLFFVDYDRDCLAFFPRGSGGVPDASAMELVASSIDNPVDLRTGPGGDLYYVDHDNGRVVRIKYVIAPIARATADPSEALAPVTVHLDGSASSDPDPGASLVAWRWDLDNDGVYDDATGATYDWAVTTPAVYPVGLEVESSNGLKDTVSLVVDATNDPPVPVIDTPGADLAWAVGDTIAFSGHADDPQDGSLTGTALQWDVVMLHCPADCHEHGVETDAGATGSFTAPDHPYPSHLELRLTATDTHGSKRQASVSLYPRTKSIQVATTPTGVTVSVGETQAVSPSTTTVLERSLVTVTPPLTTAIGGARYRFSRWDDSLVRSRDVTASADIALAATYVPDAADTCASAAATPTGSWRTDHASGNGDADWFKFTISAGHRVVITAGDLPVNARLDLYSSCATRLATADASIGTRFEELTRRLGAGTYRVRVSFPGGGGSDAPYVVRFRSLPGGTTVKSSRVTRGAGGGGIVRIVGEIINNTRATTGMATVTATFRNASGTKVGTLSGKAFARRLADGGVSPFVLRGSVPAYATVRYTVTTGALPPSRSLSLVSLTRTANGDGTVTERGTVKNTGTTTATAVASARTWYGRRGEVLDRGTATVSPSTLAPGARGTFAIVQPVLPDLQATRTQLGAS
ncbi:MAG TPA: PQQ-dependent sugar dehydrogenase [Candidatus Limnocylindrales bacterium]